MKNYGTKTFKAEESCQFGLLSCLKKPIQESINCSIGQNLVKGDNHNDSKHATNTFKTFLHKKELLQIVNTLNSSTYTLYIFYLGVINKNINSILI